MSDSGPLDPLPLWLVFVVTVVVISAAMEIGHRLGAYRRTISEHESDSPVGGIVGATLGLLALMLAFTFGMAASRFDERRQVVLDEANAIGTTYLRAGMLPEPLRSEVRKQLKEYATVRLEAVVTGEVAAAIKRSVELHDELWLQAEAAAAKDRTPITGLFVVSLNELIDLHATRVQAGLRSRIPGGIWSAVLFVAGWGMAAMGFQVGLSSQRRSLVAFAVVMAFSAVMVLIVDLDRPGEGLLSVSQQVMRDLVDSMKDVK